VHACPDRNSSDTSAHIRTYSAAIGEAIVQSHDITHNKSNNSSAHQYDPTANNGTSYTNPDFSYTNVTAFSSPH
jgi:hypothetical protein